MKNNNISTLIRIDEELYNDIKFISSLENRSINKQIEYILNKYVEEFDKKEQLELEKEKNKN